MQDPAIPDLPHWNQSGSTSKVWTAFYCHRCCGAAVDIWLGEYKLFVKDFQEYGPSSLGLIAEAANYVPRNEQDHAFCLETLKPWLPQASNKKRGMANSSSKPIHDLTTFFFKLWIKSD
ncbi:MAG: hypothetical protein M1457_07230 [bacterium]|nr:hypothetical protein [bacterium]